MIWRPSVLGFTFLVFGLFFTAIEVWGAYDYFIRDQGETNYIVIAGCGIALACAFLMPAADTAWRNSWYSVAALAMLAVPLTLAVIIFAGVQRTGSATDAAQQERKHVESSRKGWEKTEKEAEADLAVDKQTVQAECASGWRKKCAEAKEAQAATQRRLDDARAELRKAAPANQGDAASKRMAAVSFGYVTEDQVRLYQPLFVPFLVSLLAALFLTVGLRMDFLMRDEARRRDGFIRQLLSRWRRGSAKIPAAAEHLAGTQPAPHAPLLPSATPAIVPEAERPSGPNVVALNARKGKAATKAAAADRPSINGKVVVEFLRQCVHEAEGERAEWGEIFRAFRKWCAAQGVDALNARDFGMALDHICDKARWETRTEGEHVYCLDRRISGV